MSVHRDVIELLHLMGARDGYIAAQFERQALRLGLGGGVVGLALAVATLLALGPRRRGGRGPGRARAAAADGPSRALATGRRCCCCRPSAAVLAMVTARLTVLRALARMP